MSWKAAASQTPLESFDRKLLAIVYHAAWVDETFSDEQQRLFISRYLKKHSLSLESRRTVFLKHVLKQAALQ